MTNIDNIILSEGDKVTFNDKLYRIMLAKDMSYSLPQLGFGLQRYFKYITLKKITTEYIDYETIDSYQNYTFIGLVQPLRYCDLDLYPEEQRKFEWLKISTFSLQGSMHYHLREEYIPES